MLGSLGVANPHFVGLSMADDRHDLRSQASGRVQEPGALRHVQPRSPEAQPVWDERIKIASEKGMEPLVEPTLKRWFTEPFLAKRDSVVERVAALIRNTAAGLRWLLLGDPQDQSDRPARRNQVSGSGHRRRPRRRYAGAHVRKRSTRRFQARSW